MSSPLTEPDYRAVFVHRRLRVLDWRRGVRLGGPEPSPPPVGPAAAGLPRVFDLWHRGDEIVARQHGAGSAEAEIRRLQAWAEGNGTRLRVGAPLGPRGSHTGARIEIPCRPASQPPDFRFVFPDPGRAGYRLRITPWGFTDSLAGRLREPWRGVVGEVRGNGQGAVARFAHLAPELRAAARRALLSWADRDGWDLEFDEPVVPLGDPDPAPEAAPGASRCSGCRRVTGTGTVSHLAFHHRGWIRTRCDLCGGRLRWFVQRVV